MPLYGISVLTDSNMAQIKVRGLIIKQTDFGEANRMLSIFTHEHGIIRAAVYGAKSIKSKKNASTQLLTYADFILLKTGRDIMSVQSVEPAERFFAIQEDIEKLSLSVYFCDLAYAFLNTDSPDEEFLSLLLNCLWALCYKNTDMMTVKAVFELRSSAIAGYMPNIFSCVSCGDDSMIKGFSPVRGGITCKNCFRSGEYVINADIYHTMRYILTAPVKKIFSFSAEKDILDQVGKIAEAFALHSAEKDIPSLAYFKKICGGK